MQSRQWKTLGWTVALAGVLNLGMLSQGTVLAGQTKVDVCHSEGNGTYHFITIAEPAYPSHVAHGDARVGEPVPGNPEFVFAEDCSLEEAVSCPCLEIQEFFDFLDAPENFDVCDEVSSPDGSFVRIRIINGPFVAATDALASEGAGCRYFGPPQTQGLTPITVEEAVACMDLIRDIATAAGLTCDGPPN